jgi:hypothetical protein
MSLLTCGVCRAPVTADGGYCGCPGNRADGPPVSSSYGVDHVPAPPRVKGKQGFASMDPARRLLICARGGRAAHRKGTAHQFTPAEARAAGRKGGVNAHRKGTAHQFTTAEARAAGKKGGRQKGRPASVFFVLPGDEFAGGWSFRHLSSWHLVTGYPTRTAAARAYRRHVKALLGVYRVEYNPANERYEAIAPDGTRHGAVSYPEAVRLAARMNGADKEGNDGHGGPGRPGGADAGTNPRTPEVAGEGGGHGGD